MSLECETERNLEERYVGKENIERNSDLLIEIKIEIRDTAAR